MEISAPIRRKGEENVIPMINVVFLLLIFFLMTAQIAPPAPFPVEPPSAASDDPADGLLTLHISAEGELGFRDALGEEAALDALAEEYGAMCAAQGGCDGLERDAVPLIVIRADGALEAREIPRVLGLMAARDITNVQLATREMTGDDT